MTDNLRRICLDRLTPAESAIVAAVNAIEALPPDVRLTDAVILLGKARDRVADYVDGVNDVSGVNGPAPVPAAPAPDDEPSCSCGDLDKRPGTHHARNCARCYVPPAAPEATRGVLDLSPIGTMPPDARMGNATPPEATREADDVAMLLDEMDADVCMFDEIRGDPDKDTSDFFPNTLDLIRRLRAAIDAERAAQAREIETLTGALQGLRHVADRIDELAQKPTFTAYRLHLDGLTRTIRRAVARAARAPEPQP